MAGVPQNFQAISNVLPTYNFVDIISGTGYVNFYAGTTIDLNLLSNFTYYADTIYNEYNIGVSAVDVLGCDIDFDVLLNRPMDISGLGIINVPFLCRTFGGGTTTTGYAIVFIRKWTGAVETDIATNTSRIGVSNVYTMLGIDVNIPLTHFKKGETLRLTVRLYGTNTSGVNDGFVSYGHDPKSRVTGWDATGAVPSQLVFQCPVRLNL